MSKKNRNRASESEHIALGLTASTDNQSSPDETIDFTQANESVQSNEPHKIGLIAYLKNPSHWWVIGLIALFTLGVMGAGLKYLEDSARKQTLADKSISSNSSNGQNNSFLSSLNPFLPDPTPTPLPLSKEYIYAGSRMLSVVDADADAVPPADLAYWRPSTGTWYVMGGLGSQQVTVTWGTNGNTPAPGDYDGDGKTDFAVYAPGAPATWTIQKSSDGSTLSFNLGTTGDKVVQADYDGDGKTDAAVFSPSALAWEIRQSSTGTNVTPTLPSPFVLQSTDIPAPADYDGDGKADVAVYRPDSSGGVWIMARTTLGYGVFQFGLNGDTPLPADYDGDGKADYAVRRGAEWYISQSSNGAAQSTAWQLGGDIAVPNDYDGDGKVDIAVWRSGSRGTWYIRNSSSPLVPRTVYWGRTGDVPVPAFYRR